MGSSPCRAVRRAGVRTVLILLTALSLNLLATWVRAVTDPVTRWRYLMVKRRAVA